MLLLEASSQHKVETTHPTKVKKQNSLLYSTFDTNTGSQRLSAGIRYLFKCIAFSAKFPDKKTGSHYILWLILYAQMHKYNVPSYNVLGVLEVGGCAMPLSPLLLQRLVRWWCLRPSHHLAILTAEGCP